MQGAPSGPRRVAVLVYDNVTMLDVAGPADVFAHANLFGATYETVVVSPDGGDARASCGFLLHPDRSAADAGSVHLAVVPGALGLLDRPFDPRILDAVGLLARTAQQLVSVCTGSFLLAEVGALDGRRATTHWNRMDQFRRYYPAVRVESEALFVRDGPVVTSAGVSSSIDVALSIVEQDYGAETAGRTVRQMIVLMQRPGMLPQHSRRSHDVVVDGPLRALLDTIVADPAQELGVERMASLAAVSSRTLARLFREHLDTTPSQYVEQVRIEAAKALLQRGTPVARAARLTGFGSAETLRRVFVTQVGLSPSAYAYSAAPAPDPR